MPPKLKSHLLNVKKMLRLILGTSTSKPTNGRVKKKVKGN